MQDSALTIPAITDRRGDQVVSVGALLARLELVDGWDDFRELRDVLRTIVGEMPRSEPVRVPEWRSATATWAALSARLEEWRAATQPDRAVSDALADEQIYILRVEHRRLRRLGIGSWDELRIRWDAPRAAVLEGRVAGDEHPDAWTRVIRIESDSGDRDLVLRCLREEAVDRGYEPEVVEVQHSADPRRTSRKGLHGG